MIDTSRKPTATDIAIKARLLHNLAHTAVMFARDADYLDKTAQETMSDHLELLDELSAELDIMAQVLDGFSDYTDFEQLIPERCEKPKSRAQLMDELFDAFKALADANKAQQQQPEPPSEERQRVNAAIIAGLEKLGVIPPAADERAGDSE